MTFKVTILGSGSAMPSAGKHNSAHVLNVHEQFYLIDCGEGTQIQMRRYGINPLKINAIFISHLHGDHVFGLPGLISTMNFMKRGTPLYIFGVRPLDEIISNHIKYFESDLNFEIIYKEINARENEIVFENNVMEVSTIPLRHRVASSGYLFREKEPGLNVDRYLIEKHSLTLHDIVALKRGDDFLTVEGVLIPNGEMTHRPYKARSYAYCSDTQYSAKVAGIVRGVDLLYHEATYVDSEHHLAKQTGHSTALQAAKVAVMAGVKGLLLGHFSSRYKDDSLFLTEAKTLFENTQLAKEGETVSIHTCKL